MINYQYFPKSQKLPEHLLNVVNIFKNHEETIDSKPRDRQESNDVLAVVSVDLEVSGFRVEVSKKREGKITVPVLFGKNGKIEKHFDADAWNIETKTVIEVEAGRAVTNYQFLKDLFQASMMEGVDFCVIAVRNIYQDTQKDFDKVCNFMETMYASERLRLPLKGILIIGY
jgi:hypothetical protein